MSAPSSHTDPEAAPAAASAFTVSDTGAAAGAPAPVRRRGRGTFAQKLRIEQVDERARRAGPDDTSSVFTANTTAVVLQPTVLDKVMTHVTNVNGADGEEPEAGEVEAMPYEGVKTNIPMTFAAKPIPRQFFGEFAEETQEADTIRQLLFRNEKRRRYCMIVGDLQNTERVVQLKLFGHSGLKPFHLQDKKIRLVNLSIGRPRLPPPEIEAARRQAEMEACGEWSEENGEEVEGGEGGPAAVAEASEDNTSEDSFDIAKLSPPQHLLPPTISAPVAQVSVPNVGASLSQTELSRGTGATGLEDDVYHDVGDVDDYYEEEVQPLVTEHTRYSDMNEGRLAMSRVLTAKYFRCLEKYFANEFGFLLCLDDVRRQNVSIRVHLGAAYCCLARQGSHSAPLMHATFSEFVDRMNEESMQLYFIRDCPVCVSRAVDMECGALHHEASLTMVKIFFFSNERQGRSIARATWDSSINAFRLLDMENLGATFHWNVFSLDETAVQDSTSADKMGKAALAAAVAAADEAERLEMGNDAFEIRNKTVAYPFEVEFRTFRRWKQHSGHAAGTLAEAILEKLSIAELNSIQHNSSIGYERIDLSHVCEVDYASEDFNVERIVVERTQRGRPQGTDILVDNVTALYIENFAAARTMKDRISQYGVLQVAKEQTMSNNNYLRDHNIRGGLVSARGMRGRGRGASASGGGRRGRGQYQEEIAATVSDDVLEKVLQPTSKLTFFKSRGSTIHWKLRPEKSVEENIAPMTEALRFTQQVLNTANDIERTSVRGGGAPEAL